ncbi:MAG: hypothetical protein GX650_04170 [Clostridiales bacterium]|nr:hypothetical protein [Clostridiales bacterium]
MILDSGICTIYEAANSAVAGNKPIDQLTKKYESWYGELDFGSDSAYVTDFREDVETSARIRILQHRSITNRDAAELSTEPGIRYEVTRVYHALDDDSGQPISDLNLRRIN